MSKFFVEPRGISNEYGAGSPGNRAVYHSTADTVIQWRIPLAMIVCARRWRQSGARAPRTRRIMSCRRVDVYRRETERRVRSYTDISVLLRWRVRFFLRFCRPRGRNRLKLNASAHEPSTGIDWKPLACTRLLKFTNACVSICNLRE